MRNIVEGIQSPLIQRLHDNDLWQPPDLPPEIVNSDLYKNAVEDGWHEWIETPLDFEAVKQGYYFDLSRDMDDRPAYWLDGGWVLHDGTKLPMEDEHHYIAYVGKGDFFLRFAEGFLFHTKEPLAGQPYRFLPWHLRVVCPLFAWVGGAGGYRRYQDVYTAIAKKNAKSALMSVIAIYCMFAEGMPKAYVYSCACDRNQARIIYEESKNYVMGSPELRDQIEVVDSRSRLVHQPSASYYSVLASDAHRNDGIDSYCTLVDEIHRHKNRGLYTVMKRAGRARPQKILAVITTYGPSLTDGSIWAEVHNEAKAILAGDRPEAWRHLAFIASAEPIPVILVQDAKAGDTEIRVKRLEQPLEGGVITFDLSQITGETEHKVDVVVKDAPRFGTVVQTEPLPADLPIYSEAVGNTEWRSDHAIRRANPAVDQIFPISEIRKDIAEARSPEAEAETKQLSLNIVSGSGRKWISGAAWQALSKYQVQPRKLALDQRRCFGGLDLSFSNDLTAFALAFPSWQDGENHESVGHPRLDLMVWAWVPSFAIDEREQKEKFAYRHYAAQDYLINGKGPVRICEGATIDYGQVADDVKEIVQHFDCRCVAYDARFSNFVRSNMEQAGILMVEHRQGPVGMAPACKRFSEMVYKGILAHGDNPVLTRAVEGAQLAPPNRDGLTYVVKSASLSRIDPLVAAVMATHFACDPPEGTATGYVSVWG